MNVPQPYTKATTGESPGLFGAEWLTEDEAREWWRWHFAGQIATSMIDGGSSDDDDHHRARRSAEMADALIAALEAKPEPGAGR
jgi:hypothetical protein